MNSVCCNETHMKLLSLTIMICVFAVSRPGYTQADPSIEWKLMKLPHFDLVFDARHQELANAYAPRLESHIGVLKKYFQSFPSKILIVLNDKTDSVNGYATPMPYAHMVIFPVLPGSMDSISVYGDWFHELSLHEYTHILQFEPRSGVFKILNQIFGNWVTPNALLPRWWLEGLAVDLETRESSHGRMRSPWTDGALRSYVVENTLDKVDMGEINETSIPTWPFGARPYLFGALLWSEMASRKIETIGELNERYGGRIPFIIETPVREKFDQTYTELFEDAKTGLQHRVQTQMIRLKMINTTDRAPLKTKFIEAYTPVISPDNKKMIFLGRDDTTRRTINILIRPDAAVNFDESQLFSDVKDKTIETVTDSSPIPDAPGGGSVSRYSWFPDSMSFVYDKIEEVDRFSERSELYIYSLETKKGKKLSTAMRAREPTVSPDGKQLAYVKISAGATGLAVWNLESKTETILHTGQLQERISYPVYLDQNKIAFISRYQGTDSVNIYDLQNKSLQKLNSEFTQINFLVFANQKLYFVSWKNGVANIYEGKIDFQKNRITDVKPKSHSLTGLGSFGVESTETGGVYASLMTSTGFKIAKIENQDSARLPNALPVVEPLYADRYPLQSHKFEPVDTSQVSDYNSFSYLFPRYWFPSIGTSTTGNTYYGFTTGSFDPLQKQVYSLLALFEPKPQEWSFILAYQNNFFKPRIDFNIFDIKTIPILTNINSRWQKSSLDIMWQLNPISTELFFGPNYTYFKRRNEDSSAIDYYTEVTQSGPGLTLSYADYSQAGSQISPESGQAALLRWNKYLESDYRENFDYFFLHLQKYFSKWLPKRHVIYLQARGQWIDNKLVGLSNYVTTVGDFRYANSMNPFYVMRGYPPGYFIGRNLLNYNVEYRFPIMNIYRTSGTSPIFLKRFHGAVVTDGINVEGFIENLGTPVTRDTSYHSAGLEFKTDLTLWYHMPLTYTAGVYWSLSKPKNEQTVMFSLQSQ